VLYTVNIKCIITQNIIKNYASYVIIWIRSLASSKRRLQARVHLSSSFKPQATSSKLQRLKLQAASIKPQAASLKLQAASSKLLNLATLIKFQAARGEVHRKDKTILGMLHMECDLVW